MTGGMEHGLPSGAEGPGEVCGQKRTRDSSALRFPPAIFKCSGAGSESTDSWVEAE